MMHRSSLHSARPANYLPVALAILSFSLPAFTGEGAVPPPEKLLPDDTLVLVTVPDMARARQVYQQWPQSQLWNDPAMKPFKEKLVSKWLEDFVQPLERELQVKFDDFTSLPQGQLTFAVTRNGWQGSPDQSLGFLVLLDAKDKSGQLKTNLAGLRQKWVDANKPVRTEKIRDLEFLVLSMSSNDVPKTLTKFFPPPLETHELGEPDAKPSTGKSELVIGQADSLLIAGNSLKQIEKVVIRLTGGAIPTLSEQAAFDANYQALFRDAPLYGWVNAKVFVEVLGRLSAQKKENPAAPNPFEVFKMEKIIGASGLAGLKTLAFSAQASEQGILTQFFLGIPESNRQGIFKILAGEAKESTPPPFVPADAVKFSRWRIDGQKAWATLEKMLAEISPQSLNGLNFLLDTANMAAKDKDPGFDIKKNLIGNLGDDIIRYQKAARGTTPADLASAPSLFLLGSPNPEQLAASLKSIFVFLSQQAGAPTEREFLGRKVFSFPLPNLPLPIPGPRPSTPRTLNYSASGGYVAFSTDVAALEEYLRSSESQAKTLRETPGLTEAAQKVTGPGTGLFGYENQAETMRVIFEALRKDAGASKSVSGLNLLSGLPGRAAPEQNAKDWLDFTLLPSFDQVAKYFYFSVNGGCATVDGLTYKIFAPVPPGLRNTGAGK